MSTIYLLRHGALAGDFGKDHYLGCYEVPLSDEGREQMAQVGRYLADKGIRTLLTSPIGRCLESAAIIGEQLGLVAKRVPEFCELDLGDWDGKERKEIQRFFPEEYQARGRDIIHFRPPNGESFQDLQKRSGPAFLTALQEERLPMAIVAHAGVNRVILCMLLGTPLDTLFEIKQDYGCMNILAMERHPLHCKALNRGPQ